MTGNGNTLTVTTTYFKALEMIFLGAPEAFIEEPLAGVVEPRADPPELGDELVAEVAEGLLQGRVGQLQQGEGGLGPGHGSATCVNAN